MSEWRAALLAGSLACARGEDAAIVDHAGWSGCRELRAPAADVVATIAPAVGGRLLRYALGGDDALYEHAAANGRTLAADGWFMIGGYQLDLGPEHAQPEHLGLWLGPYAASADGNGVQVVSEPDPRLGVTLAKSYRLDPRSGALTVVQSVRAGAQPASCCLWDRTLCPAGGFIIAPVATTRWRAGWALDRADAEPDAEAERVGIDVADGVLVAAAGAPAGKLFCDASEGWIAYARGTLLLIKAFPLARDGTYAEHGAALACYLSDSVAELEPMSPLHRVEPGAHVEFTETWHLLRLPTAPSTAAQARALVGLIRARIGSSP